MFLSIWIKINELIFQICESLVTATSYIDYWDGMLPNDQGPRPLKPAEAKAVNNLFDWASAAALPSSDFAVDFDETAEISDGKCFYQHMKLLLILPHRYYQSPERESV